jgi:hypothetical protein
VGGQYDSADALDHHDTLHMIRSVREHIEFVIFVIDFRGASSMISVSPIGGTFSHAR